MTDNELSTPSLRPIGILHCNATVHHEAPRQSGLGRGTTGRLLVHEEFQNGLADLDGFSHVWLLFWCHHARGRPLQVQPPRDTKKRGVFATRAPQRPNPIGLSAVRLVRRDKRVLHVADHDLLDGTPILDIKPYLAYCDRIDATSAGFVDALPDDANDHRQWWQDKNVAPPTTYAPFLEREGAPGPNERSD
ncbi:MAG: tRNA (N6-threonylcarbamoyladenosine(37)-N6)-methyltransferase TrmO [bacterium]|nr:tRNA (N6-threonylcarbamoyladenosine(37)-N6)-methyltransferase TrmO [bacterium]